MVYILCHTQTFSDVADCTDVDDSNSSPRCHRSKGGKEEEDRNVDSTPGIVIMYRVVDSRIINTSRPPTTVL